MNIFALDIDPIVAARKVIWKKHIVKMPTESAQMLSTAILLLSNQQIEIESNDNVINDWQLEGLNKVSYPNHPCTIWTRTSYNNFIWLVEHGLELCKIYTYVYNKFHKSETVIKMCKDIALPEMFPSFDLTPFACCVDEEYKPFNCDNVDVIINAYNQYYHNVKIPKAKANELISNLYY